ncbi:MAG: DUF1449 family protein [Acidobacteria bacterium]|nr:DUF1449 family protein [Acidobacteriota bacterium]MCB9396776.1 DUF1449 family protein [Acidobacteriota bacterium]
MVELLTFAVHPYNILFTGVLAIILLYWLSVIVGVLDLNVLDIDADLDTEVDLDADLDVEGDADLEAGGALRGLLQFLFVGEVPLTLVLSAFCLVLWIGVVSTNWALGTSSWKMAALIVLPNLLISFFVTRIALIPFRALFRRLNAEDQQVKDVLGLEGIMLSAADDVRLGQMEIQEKNSFLRLNVLAESNQQLKKGHRVRVIQKLDAHSYQVEKLEE